MSDLQINQSINQSIN